ncbi:MAG: hypothetical protein RLY31_2595 [Bacteroidota bacterium]|jgi:hypothetical protein
MPVAFSDLNLQCSVTGGTPYPGMETKKGEAIRIALPE